MVVVGVVVVVVGRVVVVVVVVGVVVGVVGVVVTVVVSAMMLQIISVFCQTSKDNNYFVSFKMIVFLVLLNLLVVGGVGRV